MTQTAKEKQQVRKRPPLFSAPPVKPWNIADNLPKIIQEEVININNKYSITLFVLAGKDTRPKALLKDLETNKVAFLDGAETQAIIISTNNFQSADMHASLKQFMDIESRQIQ